MSRIAAIALAMIGLSPTNTALAQSMESQALKQCVLAATSVEDEEVLIRWLFIAVSRHDVISDVAQIPDVDRVAANRAMGALFNRLLFEDCSEQLRNALMIDGETAIGEPFSALGERAMTRIMEYPDVQAGVMEMGAYIDEQALLDLMAQ